MREFDIYLNKRPVEIDLTIYNLKHSDALKAVAGLAVGAIADLAAFKELSAKTAVGIGLKSSMAASVGVQPDIDLALAADVRPTLMSCLNRTSFPFALQASAKIGRSDFVDSEIGIEIGAQCNSVEYGTSTGKVSNTIVIEPKINNSAQLETHISAAVSSGIGCSLSGIVTDRDDPVLAGISIGADLRGLGRVEPVDVSMQLGIFSMAKELTPGRPLGNVSAGIVLNTQVASSIKTNMPIIDTGITVGTDISTPLVVVTSAAESGLALDITSRLSSKRKRRLDEIDLLGSLRNIDNMVLEALDYEVTE